MSALLVCDIVGCDAAVRAEEHELPDGWKVIRFYEADAVKTKARAGLLEAARTINAKTGAGFGDLALAPAALADGDFFEPRRQRTAHVCPGHPMPEIKPESYPYTAARAAAPKPAKPSRRRS